MIFTSDLLLISFDHLKMQKPFLDCGPHRPRRRAAGHTGRRPQPLTWHKLLETGRGFVTAGERQRLRRARRPFLALNSQSVKERHPVCYFNSPLSGVIGAVGVRLRQVSAQHPRVQIKPAIGCAHFPGAQRALVRGGGWEREHGARLGVRAVPVPRRL